MHAGAKRRWNADLEADVADERARWQAGERVSEWALQTLRVRRGGATEPERRPISRLRRSSGAAVQREQQSKRGTAEPEVEA